MLSPLDLKSFFDEKISPIYLKETTGNPFKYSKVKFSIGQTLVTFYKWFRDVDTWNKGVISVEALYNLLFLLRTS